MLGAASLAAVALAAVAFAAAAGCSGGGPPGANEPSTTAPAPTAPTEARARLAGLAAVAKDRRMVGYYTLRTPGRPDRTVTATLAIDGGWRVDVPGGAHGGTVDVAIASTKDGVFQCVLPSPGPATHTPACVRVAGPGGAIPAAVDPRVPHVFTDWRDVLTDRRAALSVAVAAPPAGATGACYSVESTSASLVPPLDPGIYCYAPDGTLTAAHTGFGTLIAAAPPAPGPPTIALPGPVVAAAPMTTAAPPPSPSATPAR